jgi:hypothetical protein
MKGSYDDILSRIADPPLWFDEHGVPRWVTFGPQEVSNIYCQQVVLLAIECQGCGAPFSVALSWAEHDGYLYKAQALDVSTRNGSIHYGDPPNIGCCPSGPTMNSNPKRVLEFWQFSTDANSTNNWRSWRRVPELEVELPDD